MSYWVGKKNYLGNYLGVDIFAWGKGGTVENPNERSNDTGGASTGANKMAE